MLKTSSKIPFQFVGVSGHVSLILILIFPFLWLITCGRYYWLKINSLCELASRTRSRIKSSDERKRNLSNQPWQGLKILYRLSKVFMFCFLSRTADYEVIEKPLGKLHFCRLWNLVTKRRSLFSDFVVSCLFAVNRLHIKFRVLGNHAAAEVLKEALLVSSLPEMIRSIPVSFPRPMSEDSSHGGWV